MAFDLSSIHALSDFQRNTKKHIRRLKTSGKPAVLTVNGRAEVIVQSAAAYQKLLEDQEILEDLRRLSRGIEEAQKGHGSPAREFLKSLAKQRGVPLP